VTKTTLLKSYLRWGSPVFLRFFKERRLAGVPPPEMGSSDTLAIPGDPEHLTTIKLLPEDGASAA